MRGRCRPRVRSIGRAVRGSQRSRAVSRVRFSSGTSDSPSATPLALGSPSSLPGLQLQQHVCGRPAVPPTLWRLHGLSAQHCPLGQEPAQLHPLCAQVWLITLDLWVMGSGVFISIFMQYPQLVSSALPQPIALWFAIQRAGFPLLEQPPFHTPMGSKVSQDALHHLRWSSRRHVMCPG